MNFISTFEELNKLYEEATPKATEEVVEESAVEEACTKKALTEAAEDEEIEITDEETPVEAEPVEDSAEEPVVEDEPRQLILECDKCGALVIKSEADVVADEESGLVNVDDKCAFCEETAGYTIIGVVVPYEEAEVEEPVEEGFVEETRDEAPLNETLDLKSSSKQLNDLATAIYNGLSKSITNFDRNVVISTFAGKDSVGSGGHIVISTVKNRIGKLPEGTLDMLKKRALKHLNTAGAEAEIANTKYENGVNYVILDNIKFADSENALDGKKNLDELLDISPSVSLSLNGGEGNDVDVL